MKRLLTIILLSVAIFGCSGMDIKLDYDPSFDFQRLKTYAWKSQKGPADSLVDMRVRNAVDAVLSERSYKKVNPDYADYLIAYLYTIEKESGADQVYTGIGMGKVSDHTFGGVGLGVGLDGLDYEQETLTIDVRNPKTDKLIWQGAKSQRLVKESDPKKTTAKVNEMAKEILSKFPPKTK